MEHKVYISPDTLGPFLGTCVGCGQGMAFLNKSEVRLMCKSCWQSRKVLEVCYTHGCNVTHCPVRDKERCYEFSVQYS